MLETGFFGFKSMATSILQFTFIDRSKSDEDLLLMSQTVYDQLDPLSRSHQLCLCDQNKVSCSYQYQGCTTKNKGKSTFVVCTPNQREKEMYNVFRSSKKIMKRSMLYR